MAERATTVEAVGGRPVTWLDAAQALAQGFSEKLNLTLDETELTAGEMAAAAQLRAEKYASAAWNGKV